MPGDSDLESVSTKQRRIATVAGEIRQGPLYSLSHHIDRSWMREAYRRTRKDGAVGVDGQTSEQYEEHLEDNLGDLLERAKSGRYRAPAVRRVYIPKGDGRLRPLGIPTLEDKVLQRAVVMALEPVYEQDFLDCSYGFRPGRSAHQALEALWLGLMRTGGGWVVDVDIQGFFDNLDHGHLREILRQRVTDGVVLRLIGKWLNAGVLEDGSLQRAERGTPQGGVISPLLANIYLHEVLDTWFEREVRPRLAGPAFLIRYADDFVIVCKHESDARRLMEVLPKRLGRYGLNAHPEKTRLVHFERPAPATTPDRESRPGTFDLLGFTHYWAKSRKGGWAVKRQTAKKRLQRALKAVAVWCRQYRHWPVGWQHQQLVWKLRGHYGYYGVSSNYPSLQSFRALVVQLWRKWLDRRSQRGRMDWRRYNLLLRRYPLPAPYLVGAREVGQRTR